ncbi:tyrosine-type recombinase/integrase [Streptomyces sp. NPDC001009]
MRQVECGRIRNHQGSCADGLRLRTPPSTAREPCPLRPHPHQPRQPISGHTEKTQWKRIRAAGRVDFPEGMVLYGNRHFFASNCLSNGIPITDVAEWMGHKSLDITFKIYRHLMPGSIGKAAQVLDMALAA